MKENSRTARALAATAVAHVLWGFSYLASRTAFAYTSVPVLLSHRFLLALAALSLPLLLGLVRFRRHGKRLLLLLLLGLADPVAYFLFEQFGLLHGTSIFSGVMIALIPMLATLAAAPVLKERPTAGQLLFGLLSVAGVIGIGLLSRDEGVLDWVGVLCMSLAVVAAVVFTLLSRRICREFSAFERTYAMFAVGAVAFTGSAMAELGGDLAAFLAPLAQGPYLLSVLFLGLCCSVVCYCLLSFALTHLEVARESVFANLTTVVSVLSGAFLLGEPFSWREGLLCLLILIGIYGVQRCGRRSGA